MSAYDKATLREIDLGVLEPLVRIGTPLPRRKARKPRERGEEKVVIRERNHEAFNRGICLTCEESHSSMEEADWVCAAH